MEFEKSKPVSDEDRRLAEAKKLTLQPLHTDVAAEDLSDSAIATRHILEPAISNIATDMEQTAVQVMPTKSLLDAQSSSKPSAHKLVLGIAAGIITFTGLAVFAILK